MEIKLNVEELSILLNEVSRSAHEFRTQPVDGIQGLEMIETFSELKQELDVTLKSYMMATADMHEQIISFVKEYKQMDKELSESMKG